LKDLVDIIAVRGDKNLAMLRHTAVKLSEFLDKPIGEISIDVLVDVRSPFSDYSDSANMRTILSGLIGRTLNA